MQKKAKGLQLFVVLFVVAFLLITAHESLGAFREIHGASGRYPGADWIMMAPSHNQIVRDSTGKLYVVYTLLPGYNYIRWSNDNGTTWSDPVRTETLPDSSTIQSLVIDASNNLYQGFTFNVGSFFTKSTDGGVTWSAETALHDGGWGAWDYNPSLVIDGSGTLHTVYYAAFGWGDWPGNVIYKTSSDGGSTWSSGIDLTNIPNSSNYGLGAVQPNIYAGSGNNLFVLYSDYLTESSPYPITKRLLHFDGATWSAPLAVSTDSIGSWAGDIAVDSTGLLHIIYHEQNTTTQNYQILYRTYNPSTKLFSAPTVLTPDSINAYYSTMGIYLGDKVVVAYDIYDNQNQKFAGVYVMNSSDSFTAATRVSVHPEARWPNLRSAKYGMNQSDKMDLIWIEPNDITGGEDLVFFLKDAPDITVVPSTLNFEYVLLNESLVQTITITNTGTVDLVISSIEITGTSPAMFNAVQGTTNGCTIPNATVIPGSSCTLDVTFTPDSTGTKDALISINSDDPDTARVQISMTGEGVIALTEPSKGTIGTEITVIGSGFGDKKGKVLIGGAPIKIAKGAWASGSITGVINKVLPSSIPCDVVLQIKEPKGAAPITLSGAFTMMAPEITSVDPGSGSNPDEIEIVGNYFGTKKGKVYLEVPGGKPKSCKVTSWGMNSITFAVPKTSKSFPAGSYPLKVTNKLGTTYAPLNFTVD